MEPIRIFVVLGVVGNVTCHGIPKQPHGMSVLWRANA